LFLFFFEQNEAYARLVIDQREFLLFYATKKKAKAQANAKGGKGYCKREVIT
jgi:hypothetical protein